MHQRHTVETNFPKKVSEFLRGTVYFRPENEEILVLGKDDMSVFSRATLKPVTNVALSMPLRLLLPQSPPEQR